MSVSPSALRFREMIVFDTDQDNCQRCSPAPSLHVVDFEQAYPEFVLWYAREM